MFSRICQHALNTPVELDPKVRFMDHDHCTVSLHMIKMMVLLIMHLQSSAVAKAVILEEKMDTFTFLLGYRIHQGFWGSVGLTSAVISRP